MNLFTVYGDPVTQGSMRHVGKGRMIHHNQAKLLAWRKAVGDTARLAGVTPLDGPVALVCIFHLRRPKTVKRAAPTVMMDIDKLARAVLDSLTGIGYEDDGQVVSLVAVKKYAEGEPYAEIIVKPA